MTPTPSTWFTRLLDRLSPDDAAALLLDLLKAGVSLP